VVTTLLSCFPLAGFGSSVLDAFWLSNTAGKVIVIIHFFGSILAWSVMITKWKELGRAQHGSARFMTMYRKEPYPISLFLRHQKHEGSPFFRIYEGVCRSLAGLVESHGGDPSDLFAGEAGAPRRHLRDSEIKALRSRAESIMAEQALLLESGMTLLAMAVSAAPTLGLLGTVWGLMEAFGVISTSGQAMLSAVAPGVSGALLTTVTGLLVALPSVVVYNMLSEHIRGLCVRMENFLQEFLADIDRHYGPQD